MDKNSHKYWRTYAILETGEEVVGFGKAFKVGQAVEYFYDSAHNITKMQLPKSIDNIT